MRRRSVSRPVDEVKGWLGSRTWSAHGAGTGGQYILA